LRPGGFVYVDNDHMEGSLSESWQNYGVSETFPTGCTRDNIDLKTTRQAVWFDVRKRLIRFKRQTVITDPREGISEVNFIQQKHPVSKQEVESWLLNTGFSILKVYGDYQGNVYTKASQRAIFWAQKV
jgi:hypothetical protein